MQVIYLSGCPQSNKLWLQRYNFDQSLQAKLTKLQCQCRCMDDCNSSFYASNSLAQIPNWHFSKSWPIHPLYCFHKYKNTGVKPHVLIKFLLQLPQKLRDTYDIKKLAEMQIFSKSRPTTSLFLSFHINKTTAVQQHVQTHINPAKFQDYLKFFKRYNTWYVLGRHKGHLWTKSVCLFHLCERETSIIRFVRIVLHSFNFSQLKIPNLKGKTCTQK